MNAKKKIVSIGWVALLFWSVTGVPAGALNCVANAEEESTETKVVLLGTGNPNADPDRSGPAVAIIIGDTPYLIDCGPGIVRRAAAAHRKGVAALRVDNLKHLFVTHLHTDHTVGLADLIFTPWVLGRDQSLKILGPPGIQSMVDHVHKAYAEDIRIRLDGLEPANDQGYRTEVHEIKPGVIYRDAQVTVTAFPVHHGSWRYAFGFRFDTPDRSIVISGDAAPSEALISNAAGCDVLIHEVYSQAKFHERPPVWQRYHSSFHTSTFELAKIADKIQPKLLVLYHQIYWGATDDELLAEIRQHYDGPVVSGSDLDVY